MFLLFLLLDNLLRLHNVSPSLIPAGLAGEGVCGRLCCLLKVISTARSGTQSFIRRLPEERDAQRLYQSTTLEAAHALLQLKDKIAPLYIYFLFFSPNTTRSSQFL